MVARRLTVVDLDGTLVAGNTLHIYIKCAMRRALRRSRATEAFAIAWFAGLRRLGLISHRRMKFAILQRVRTDGELRAMFVKRVNSLLRPEVRDLLEHQRAAGNAVLLATAAADVYVPWIWQGPYVATPIGGNPGRHECRGADKLAAVNSYCRQKGCALHMVVTDHHDDLALLTAGAQHNVLVHPDGQTRTVVAMAGVKNLTIIG